ncbi:hypothetical protein D3C85_1303250 [compost metagenome]
MIRAIGFIDQLTLTKLSGIDRHGIESIKLATIHKIIGLTPIRDEARRFYSGSLIKHLIESIDLLKGIDVHNRCILIRNQKKRFCIDKNSADV